MTSISPIMSTPAKYNAVKIQVNDPRTIIPENYKKNPLDDSIYNATEIEVNRPSVEVIKDSIYNYPQGPLITYNLTGIGVVPAIPQANTLNQEEVAEEIIVEEAPVEEAVVEEIQTVLPEANYTTIEAEKLSNPNVSFQGLSFKAKEIEIVPGEEIKPEIDIKEVVKNLSSENFDTQALQMEKIAKASMDSSEAVFPYIVADVFTSLNNILKLDTSNMEKPSEEQIEARKKIVINTLIKEQALAEDKEIDDKELPYQISDEDIKLATTLTEIEQAERNKEYALYTIAILAKAYVDEVESLSGNIIPITDLPGIAEIVDTLKQDKNASIRIASIDALRYIERPEYKNEIVSILKIAAKDENPYVARNAEIALMDFEN